MFFVVFLNCVFVGLNCVGRCDDDGDGIVAKSVFASGNLFFEAEFS